MNAVLSFMASAVAGALTLLAITHVPQVRLEVQRGPTYRIAVVAEAEAAGSYTITVEREGASGRTRSRQGGRFHVTGSTADTLAVVRVNVAPGDSVHAELVVEGADGRTTRDSIQEAAEAEPGD